MVIHEIMLLRLISKVLGGIVLGFLLGGCAMTSVYPICLYNSSSNSEAMEMWNAAKPSLEAVISQATNSDQPAAVLTSTAAIVTAKHNIHKKLSGIWPSVACIGKTNTLPRDDVNLRGCQAEVAKFIDDPWRSWPGDASFNAPSCYQVE